MGTAYYYVTGPVHVYVRFPKVGAGPYRSVNDIFKSGGTPEFLGHTEKSPETDYDYKWKPVFSSWAGEIIPDDKLYQGQETKIALPLARFSNTVFFKLQAAPNHGRNGVSPGSETFLDIGKLLQRNGLGFELWLRNGFYGTENMAAYPDIEIGRYFPCCNIVKASPVNQGRQTENAQLLIEPNWIQSSPEGNRVCFTSDPSYFKILPPPN